MAIELVACRAERHCLSRATPPQMAAGVTEGIMFHWFGAQQVGDGRG
ncbi:hypothetical protein ACFW1M_41725 [Streptomyces inhibens]